MRIYTQTNQQGNTQICNPGLISVRERKISHDIFSDHYQNRTSPYRILPPSSVNSYYTMNLEGM